MVLKRLNITVKARVYRDIRGSFHLIFRVRDNPKVINKLLEFKWLVIRFANIHCVCLVRKMVGSRTIILTIPKWRAKDMNLDKFEGQTIHVFVELGIK